MEPFLRNIAESNLNLLFCGATMALAVYAAIRRGIAEPGGAGSEFVSASPNLCISLGILGTFVGIYFGLLDFSVSHLDTSIPRLLEGMKTAFVTSVVGMVCGLFLKLWFAVKSDLDVRQEVAASSDPVVLLQATVQSIRSMEAVLVRTLRSDDDTSVLSQMQKVRAEVVDTRRELVAAFRDFTDGIREQGMAQIVDAMRQVLADFNTQLGDLVGAEFHQLRKSVDGLVAWQAQHHTDLNYQHALVRQSLEALEKATISLCRIGDGLTSIDGLLASVATSTENLSLDTEGLAAAMSTSADQHRQLAELLLQIDAMRVRLETGLPGVQDGLEGLVETASNLLQREREVSASTRATLDASSQRLDTAQRAFEQTHTDHLKRLELHLEQQLAASLGTLTGSLAQLSGRFVEDYGPLTERLRSVVRLAEGGDS